MAATASILSKSKIPAGGKVMTVSTVTFDAAYPAGGESVSANLLGLTRIEAVICSSVALNVATAGSQEGYNCAAVIASGGASVTLSLLGAGVANTNVESLEEADAITDQSATTVTVLAIGV